MLNYLCKFALLALFVKYCILPAYIQYLSTIYSTLVGYFSIWGQSTLNWQLAYGRVIVKLLRKIKKIRDLRYSISSESIRNAESE